MSIESAVKKLEKAFGKGTLIQMGGKPEPVEVIPTGSLAIDLALGVGGYPRGRIVEMYGPESSGKTTLALLAVAEAQHLGLSVAYIDAEHALDPAYAGKLGVDMPKLWLAQPTTAEEALTIVDHLARSQEVGLVVVDSVAALTPKAELEGEIGDSHMGLMARLMSQSMRMLTANIKTSNTTVIFINQIRMKIGVFFGNPETTPGGLALKFYASQRLDIRRTGTIKDGDEAVGSKVRVRVVKNKVAPPFRVAELELLYDRGVNRPGELVDLAEQYGVLEKKGSWYTYDGKNVAQGRDNTSRWLVDADKQGAVRDTVLEKVRNEKTTS